MFKNYSDCARCIHTSVCQYKSILKESCNKIKDHWDKLATPDVFKLELECKEYEANEKTKSSGLNSWF